MGEFATEELTISIKVLKVNSKRMTQSVFRQLPEKSIFDKNLELFGRVWGSVNYFWGDQNTFGLHLVWEKEGVLYRCIVSRLVYTAQDAHNLLDHEEINIAKELPHSALSSVVNDKRSFNAEKAERVFQKYQDHYNYFSSIGQLFIST